MPIRKSLEALRKLIGTSTDNYTPSLETFPQPNIADIERTYKIHELAKERGKINQPPLNFDGIDPVEADLVNVFQYELNSSHIRYVDEQELYDERLQKLNFQGRFAFINAAVAQAIADFRVEANFNSTISLVGRRDKLREAKQQLVWFREKNKLIRTAEYPTMGFKVFRLGIIAVLLLAEAIINGSFLRKGGGGWLGGTATAIAFAFVNIVFSGIITHYGIRQIFHRNVFRKLLGTLSLSLFIGMTIVINTVLAVYREAAADLNVTNIEQDVVQRIKLSLSNLPSGLVDLYSFQNIDTYILLLVGIIFAFIVMADVLGLDDYYPKYGNVHRHYHEQLDYYAEDVKSKIDDLQSLRDEAVDTLDSLKREFALRLEEYEFILGRRRNLYQKFQSHVTELRHGLEKLVREYRKINIESRTQPSQGIFNYPVRLQALTILEPVAKEESLTALRKEHEKIVEVLTSQSSNLHVEFEKAAQDFNAADTINSLGS